MNELDALGSEKNKYDTLRNCAGIGDAGESLCFS